MAKTSASSAQGIATSTGPNTSSRAIRQELSRPVNMVGSGKNPVTFSVGSGVPPIRKSAPSDSASAT